MDDFLLVNHHVAK